MAGRIKRTWQLGMLAKDMVRAHVRHKGRSGVQARVQVAERMARMHGIPQKVGQILALMDLTNPESAYASLTEGAESLPAREAFTVIGQYLDRDPGDCFQHIEKRGIAASLAQVHRAVLRDGRVVAVKFQYPRVADDIAVDLKTLGWLLTPVGSLQRGGFDFDAYQREVAGMLHQELDYRHEAASLTRFRNLARDFDGLLVPEVIPELSGERILTMTWIDGQPFSAVTSWPTSQREDVARLLIRLFLVGCLRWHCLHADPHPGNYRFQSDHGKVMVGLLDFGCVHELGTEEAAALEGFLHLARADSLPSAQEVLSRYAALGFRADMLAPMAHLLPALTGVLLEPFRAPQPYSVENWRLSERVAATLGPLRWNFRVAGPASLIYFIRAFQGLIRYVQALRVAVDWRAILDEVLTQSSSSVPQSVAEDADPAPAAAHLRLRVRESGQTRVELTFPARAAEDLANLVPPEIEEKLAARAIDVACIARESKARGFAPEELFVFNEAGKEVRVWLE